MQRVAFAALSKGFWIRLAGALALLGMAGVFATGALGDTVTGSSGTLKATMQAPTHNPKVNAKWTLHFSVSSAGKPAKATVSFYWLYGGAVVAGPRERHTFTGSYTDTLTWPAQAVGEPLTFRAAIVSGKSTIDLDYAVKVVQ